MNDDPGPAISGHGASPGIPCRGPSPPRRPTMRSSRTLHRPRAGWPTPPTSPASSRYTSGRWGRTVPVSPSPATAGISRAGLPTDDRGRRPSRSRSPRSSTRASAPRTPRCRSPAGIASSPSRSGTRRSTNREGTPRSSCFTSEEAFQPPEGAHGAELIELMSLSQEEFSRRFKNSPVERAKRRGLLRNVAVAALGRTRIRGGRTRRWPATGI
jgi:hypothetical protein